MYTLEYTFVSLRSRLLRMNNCYQFSAIRGTQAHRAFYVAMLPYSYVEKLLGSVGTECSKRGRPINKARLPAISAYLHSASEGHCVPPIHVMVDGLMRFEAAECSRSVGHLYLDVNAALNVIDGRHRIAGIGKALANRPGLARETLPVCFYASAGEEAARVMFETINGKAIRPARSNSRAVDSSTSRPT